MENDNRIMNIDELAAYLQLSKSTLYKLSQEGKIPRQKIGRHWRYNREFIDEWIANQGGMAVVENAPADESVSARLSFDFDLTPYFTPEQMQILTNHSLNTLAGLVLHLATVRGKQQLAEILNMKDYEMEEIATQIVDDCNSTSSVSVPSEDKLSYHVTLNHNGRECLDGRILYAGTTVLRNPDFPDEFMEDTPKNREEFKKRSYIWKEDTRLHKIKATVDDMVQQGLGRPGAASIRVKTVSTKTGIDAGEVLQVFLQLQKNGGYEVYKTENGDEAIKKC